jgi:hypothetical protein
VLRAFGASGVADYFCRNSGHGRSLRDVGRYDGIGANAGMSTDMHWAQNFCASPNINVALDHRSTAPAASSDRHLLKDQTVHTNLSIWVNHDTVRVRSKKSTADLAIERNVGASDDTPKSVDEHEPFAKKP